MKRTSAALAAGTVTALTGAVLAACGLTTTEGERGMDDRSSGDDTEDVAAKSGTGERRTDPEPLVQRFDLLDAATSVTWFSGSYGDERNPGPSTLWIDAVVTVPAATVDAWTQDYALVPTDAVPDVVDDLAGDLPPGPNHASAALDDAVDSGRWSGSAYVDPATGQVVLVLTGAS